MSVKRWTEGVDYESKCEFVVDDAPASIRALTSPHPEVQRRVERAHRRHRGIRIGSIDHMDLVMQTWADNLKCAVCQKKTWRSAVYVRLNASLLAFPTCGSKACNETLRKDAIAENPNIN